MNRKMLFSFLLGMILSVGLSAYAQEECEGECQDGGQHEEHHQVHHGKARTGFVPAHTDIYTADISCNGIRRTYNRMSTALAFEVVGKLECDDEIFYVVYTKMRTNFYTGDVLAFRAEDVAVY